MVNIYPTGLLPAQSMLQGRYSIIETAGKGNMGAVYKALDIAQNRVVAVKEMKASNLSPEKLHEAENLFRQEANFLSKLSHPNIPRVYDFFAENGRSYLVMDFIEGKTLLQLLNEHPDHQLPIGDVSHYAMQLCQVLSYLHAQSPQIIFRDLKPSNVIVTANNQIYLIDFGIARFFKQGQLRDTIPLGSLGFCPPEQFDGQTEPGSDLYSLGATLHFCLTGHPPNSNKPTLFDFPSIRTYNPLVPIELDKLIQWLVATKVKKRPTSADQVLSVLQALNQWAGSPTSPLNGNGSLYDAKTARATQSRVRLIELNKLPGWLGTLWATIMIPFLSEVYGEISVWFVLTFLPFLRKHFATAKAFSSTLFTRIQQALVAVAPVLGKVRISPNTFTAPVWMPYFSVLFVLLPLLLISTCAVIGNIWHISQSVLALFLSVALACFTFGMSFSRRVQRPLARSILVAMAIALLLVALGLQSVPDVQQFITHVTLGQLLATSGVLLALFSIVRPAQRFIWLDHTTLLLTFALTALLQYAVGAQEFSHVLQIRTGSSAFLSLIVTVVLLVLLLIALLRMRTTFSWGDRLSVFLAICACAGMQFTFGLQEMAQGASNTAGGDPLAVASFNLLLISVPALLAFVWLFLRPRNAWVERIPLLPFAIAVAWLQSFLGKDVSFPSSTATNTYPLLTKLTDVLNINQLIAYGLIGIALMLFWRLRTSVTRIDRIAIYTVALACALLQTSAWSKQEAARTLGTTGSVLSNSLAPNNSSSLYIAAFNNVIGQSMMILVLVGSLIAIGAVFLFIARQFHWVNTVTLSTTNRFTWIEPFVARLDHGMVLGIALISVLLQLFFGSGERLLVYSFQTQGMTIHVDEIVTGILIITVLVALFRFSRPFTGVDRFLVAVSALACALLLFRGQDDKHLPVAIPGISHWIANPHLALPLLCIGLGLFLAVLVSLGWFRGPYPLEDRHLLLICSGVAAFCMLLALIPSISSVFVLATLIILLQGIVLALRVEAVR